MDLKLIKNRVQEIVRDAGKIMTEETTVTDTNLIDEKAGDANFVTVYDVAVQKYLIEKISEILPDAYFVAEEKENDYNCLQKDYCFVIDPIDGTTNFIHGYKHSAISVAMFSRGEALLGVIYDPYLDEMFIATKGGGAFLNGEPIRVAETEFKNAVCIFGTSPYCKSELADITFKAAKALFLNCADIRRSGSAALDLAYVGAGRCDIFYEARLSPWDFSAGALIIKEAGGIVTQANGEEMDFTGPVSIIAASPSCHKKALEILK